MAVQNELTLKPPTISSQIRIIMALITNKKSPNVKMVKGKVNSTKIGLMKTLSNPKTMATQIAEKKLSISMPEIKYGSTKTRLAVISILRINFMN